MSFSASISGHGTTEEQEKLKTELKEVVNNNPGVVTVALFNNENLIEPK